MPTAARPECKLEYVTIVRKAVPTAKAVTQGYGVIYSTDEDHVEDSGANGLVWGVALESAVALADARIVMLTGGGVVPVKVGTGGATAGKPAIMAADGWTDQVMGGGTTLKHAGGFFTQTGVAGDIIGMRIAPFDGVAV